MCIRDSFYNRETGQAIADYVTVRGEKVDDSMPITIFDPVATWKKKVITNYRAESLLVQVFDKGRCVYTPRPLEEIKKYCAEQVARLWEEVRRFEHPHRYYVDLSDRLWNERNDLLERINLD